MSRGKHKGVYTLSNTLLKLALKFFGTLDIGPGMKTTIGAALMFVAVVAQWQEVITTEQFTQVAIVVSALFGVTLGFKGVRKLGAKVKMVPLLLAVGVATTQLACAGQVGPDRWMLVKWDVCNWERTQGVAASAEIMGAKLRLGCDPTYVPPPNTDVDTEEETDTDTE